MNKIYTGLRLISFSGNKFITKTMLEIEGANSV